MTRKDLPPPPAGKTGWPWTADEATTDDVTAGDRPWPRITVVTPSYNQAEFLEATLRSVLLQGYPNLEYIVIDGGSEDGSLEVIRRYEPWIDHWVSEPDRGQSHAINKGFARSTGELLAWLNSDDIYYPGALHTVALEMERTGCDIYLGAMDKVEIADGDLRFVRRSTPHEGLPIHTFPVYANGGSHEFHFIQPPLFWRRRVWERAGPLDEAFHYVMDVEWCTRAIATGATIETSEEVLARFLLHDESKSTQLLYRFPREKVSMYLNFLRSPGLRPLQCCLAALLPLQQAFSLKARRDRMEGRVGRALVGRAAAAGLRRLRRIPALRGRTSAEAVPASPTGREPTAVDRGT